MEFDHFFHFWPLFGHIFSCFSSFFLAESFFARLLFARGSQIVRTVPVNVRLSFAMPDLFWFSNVG